MSFRKKLDKNLLSGSLRRSTEKEPNRTFQSPYEIPPPHNSTPLFLEILLISILKKRKSFFCSISELLTLISKTFQLNTREGDLTPHFIPTCGYSWSCTSDLVSGRFLVLSLTCHRTKFMMPFWNKWNTSPKFAADISTAANISLPSPLDKHRNNLSGKNRALFPTWMKKRKSTWNWD